MVCAFSTRFPASTWASSAALAMGAACLTAGPALAESAAIAPQTSPTFNDTIFIPAIELDQFRPAEKIDQHTIDFTYLAEALQWFVEPMGP